MSESLGTRAHRRGRPQWSRNDTVAELKLGYKASAEQFAPRELVELAVAAEAHGMDSATVSDHFQPWRHEGGHAPFSLAWMTAVGERTKRLQLGTSVLTPTFRYNPAVIAQAFATMGVPVPGPDLPRRRHRRVAQRDRHRLRGRVAGVQGALRAAARIGAADARAVARRPGRLRGRVLQHQGRLDLRRARGRHPDLHRRGRTAGGQVRRPRGRRLHLHLRQGRGAVQGQADPRHDARAPRPRARTPTTSTG